MYRVVKICGKGLVGGGEEVADGRLCSGVVTNGPVNVLHELDRGEEIRLREVRWVN